MKVLRLTPFIAAALIFAACEKAPTQANSSLALLDSVDQVVLTFNATSGLPGEPFHGPGPGSKGDARGPGAPFPDSLKLSTAQQAQIQLLRDAFKTANAVDLAALEAIHVQAAAAMKAGKTRDEVRSPEAEIRRARNGDTCGAHGFAESVDHGAQAHRYAGASSVERAKRRHGFTRIRQLKCNCNCGRGGRGQLLGNERKQ
jgi:hypothetical protein